MGYLDDVGSQEWLRLQLERTGLFSLSGLAQVSGIHKGTLSKYFRQIQRPTVDVLAILCKSLQVSPTELLIGLGAIDFDDYPSSEINTKPAPRE